MQDSLDSMGGKGSGTSGSLISKIAIMLVSALVAILMLEAGYRLIKGDGDYAYPTGPYNVNSLLYEAGETFVNVGPIFKYAPNRSIRTYTAYAKDADEKDVIKEFEYQLQTNNLGLIMTNNVPSGTRVSLFLGDSYTEGFGAAPWFYKVEQTWDKDSETVPVNGGLLGTGPKQWQLLAAHLVDEFKLVIEDLHIILILPDLYRDIWNFDELKLDCLRTAECAYSSGIQGYRFASKSDADILAEVDGLLKKKPKIPEISISRTSPLQLVKGIFRHSVAFNDVNAFFKSLPSSGIVKENIEALDQLMAMANGRFKITVVSTKEEMKLNGGRFDLKSLSLGKRIKQWSDEKRLRLNICELAGSGYHVYDGHPNEQGYAQLMDCVLRHHKA